MDTPILSLEKSIPNKIINYFNYGILNAHGGDLPRYRGNACQAWAILNGENKIGLCIHKMVGGELDSGDIISRDYLDIGENTKIGANTVLFPNVVVMDHCEIGKDCLIHPGTVIGADGFGWAPDNGKWLKIPQLGRVVIKDNVEIGASTTVDRGALDDTVISSGCIIDNQCQIAHNVFIDEDTAIAGCTVLAGSCRIGKRCMIGGASAINGHISVCDDVQIMGFAMVIKEITEPGVYASGIPASGHREWRRNGARFRQLDDLFKRVKELEKQADDNN